MKYAAIAALIGVALLSLGVACSGSDDGERLTLEEYIDSLEHLSPTPEISLFDEFDIQAGTPVTENEAFMSASATETALTVLRLDALEPPSVIEDAHNQMVEFAPVQARLMFSTTDAEYIEATDRIFEAVCEIYLLADEAGIDHDFATHVYCGPDAPDSQRLRTPTPQ